MSNLKNFFFIYDIKKKKLNIEKSKLKFNSFNNKSFKLFYLGEPKIKGLNIESEVNNNLDLQGRFLKKLDGEFLILILDYKKNFFYIINDRFTSIPVFYILINSKLYCSDNYIYLYNKIKKKINLKLKPLNFFEFLFFRKIHGNKAYDDKIKFLNFATKLQIDKKINEFNYWFPKFHKKNYKNINETSKIFIRKTFDAIENKIDKKKNTNLFLSGGLDTRFILASLLKLKYRPTCYTFGFNKKSEFFYSKLLTKISNLKHFFLKIKEDEILRNQNFKFNLSGGMFNYYINFFSKQKLHKLKINDNTLHGHGFDYLFQGMYIPSVKPKIFGKETYLKFPVNLSKKKNIIKYYFYNSNYKTSNFDINNYLKKDYKNNILKKIIQTLNQDFRELKRIKDNNDKWEYIMIKNLSRHYSHLDVISLSEYGNNKTITFDNNLFDFYLTLKKNFRFDGKMIKKSLSILNKKFANIPSANHGQKIVNSSYKLFFNSIIKKIIYTISKNERYKHPASHKRTFPNLDEQIKNSKYLQKNIEKMFKSKDFINFLYFINFKNIEKDYLLMLKNKKKNLGQILFLLSHLLKLKKKLV